MAELIITQKQVTRLLKKAQKQYQIENKKVYSKEDVKQLLDSFKLENVELELQKDSTDFKLVNLSDNDFTKLTELLKKQITFNQDVVLASIEPKEPAPPKINSPSGFVEFDHNDPTAISELYSASAASSSSDDEKYSTTIENANLKQELPISEKHNLRLTKNNIQKLYYLLCLYFTEFGSLREINDQLKAICIFLNIKYKLIKSGEKSFLLEIKDANEKQRLFQLFDDSSKEYFKNLPSREVDFYSRLKMHNNIQSAMQKAIQSLDSRWYSTHKDEKLTRLKKLKSKFDKLLASNVEPSEIKECIKEFIREVSVARDGSKNAKTKSSEAFFNRLNADTKNYVFGLMGSTEDKKKTWHDFVELVESGRALPQDMSLLNLTNKKIDELYDSVFNQIPPKDRKLKLSEPIDKLQFLCRLNGITAYELYEKKDGFKLIAKTTDLQKFGDLKVDPTIFDKLQTLDIYNAMTKAIENLEKASRSGERDSKLRNLKEYRDRYTQMSHQEFPSQDGINKCLKDFIQEAARARNSFLGGSTDAKTNSTSVFFNHLDKNARHLVFDALGKANQRHKDFDSFIDVLNKEREKTVATNIAPINEPAPTIQKSLVAAMEKAIGKGWFSGEKTPELIRIKEAFSNQNNSEEDIKRFLLEFIKVAAEPRGFKTVSFGQTKSCVKFFEALDEQSKQYVFEAFDDGGNYYKDFQSFVETINKFFKPTDSKTLGRG